MKNIQVIDGAENCVYDVFSATDEEFALVFPLDTDVAFIDEVYANGDEKVLNAAFNAIWKRRIKKSAAQGIHGILFYELPEKEGVLPDAKR